MGEKILSEKGDPMGKRETNLTFEERAAAILQYLDENNSITVDAVVELCRVSHSTARTQLGEMHNRGLLLRTHGGAVKRTAGVVETRAAAIANLAIKESIAAVAASQIVQGDIVAIGGGTTGLCLARALREVRDIVVVTNSVRIATELQCNRNIELHISGGVLRTMNGSCSGTRAEDFFHNITATKSFIGVDSVSAKTGFTAMNPDERTERAVLCCAKKRYVIFDHTKFTKGPYVDRLASFEDINVCITDKAAAKSDVDMLLSMGIEVILA